MLQNSRKPEFQFLLIRSGINMSALCLPASCCRSQIFLQYFNSHFLETSAASYLEIFWLKKYQFSNYNFDRFSVFIWQSFKVGFLSRFFVPHSGEEEEEEEEEEEKGGGGRLTQNTTLPHYSRPLGQLPPQAPAQILPFTFQINMKNFTFLNLPRKSVDEQCSGVEWGLCIESNRVATQTVKYHPNFQNRTWTHKSVQTHTPQNRDITILSVKHFTYIWL